MRYEHNQLKKLVKEIHFYTVVANSKNENDPHNSTAPQFSAENGLKVRRYQTQHENTNEGSSQITPQPPMRDQLFQPKPTAYRAGSAKGRQEYQALESSEHIPEIEGTELDKLN